MCCCQYLTLIKTNSTEKQKQSRECWQTCCICNIYLCSCCFIVSWFQIFNYWCCRFIILVLINILFWSILLSFFTFIITILFLVLNFWLCYFYICLHAFTTSICLGQGWQHNKGGHDNKGLRILHTLHTCTSPPCIILYV